MSRERKELPLMTARAVIRIDTVGAANSGDTRVFWTHEESILKRKHRCCVQWDRDKKAWAPTDDPCPPGTHDHLRCYAYVINANTATPWKRAKSKSYKANPQMKINIAANGEIARILWLAEDTDRFLVQGHVSVYYDWGKFHQLVNLFEIKQVSEQDIKSRLSIMAFDQFRQAVQENAVPIKSEGPIDNSFVTQVRARRLAKSRGEIQEE